MAHIIWAIPEMHTNPYDELTQIALNRSLILYTFSAKMVYSLQNDLILSVTGSYTLELMT